MHALSILERFICQFLGAATSECGHWELLFIYAARGIETFFALTWNGHFEAGCSNPACNVEE